jgi:hypothetical protein
VCEFCFAVMNAACPNCSYIWRRVNVMKLLIIQLSLVSCYFISPGIKIFSSVPCSQTPSVHVCPLISETMFQIHTKLQTKL